VQYAFVNFLNVIPAVCFGWLVQDLWLKEIAGIIVNA